MCCRVVCTIKEKQKKSEKKKNEKRKKKRKQRDKRSSICKTYDSCKYIFSSRNQRRLKEMQEIRFKTELTKAIKLCRENSCIMRENRKLRERTLELLQENKILQSYLGSTVPTSLHIPSWLVKVFTGIQWNWKVSYVIPDISLSGTGN
jgi:hypothetical protein